MRRFTLLGSPYTSHSSTNSLPCIIYHSYSTTRWPTTLLVTSHGNLVIYPIRNLATLLSLPDHGQTTRKDCSRSSNIIYLVKKVIRKILVRQDRQLASWRTTRTSLHVDSIYICTSDHATMSDLVLVSHTIKPVPMHIIWAFNLQRRYLLHRCFWKEISEWTGSYEEGGREVAE